MSATADPFAETLIALCEGGVEFVVVGVGGINFYARDAAELVVTGDIDVLLRRDAGTLRAALAALARVGFTFEAGREPFLDLDDDLILTRVCEVGASILARNEEGVRVDLMTSMTGFGFEDLSADAATFEIRGIAVRVGSLAKLLRSKELSGRSKDVEFLRMFAARLTDEDDA